MKSRFNNETEHIEVSLTPLIDTVLVLLIIFMVATPAILHSFKMTLAAGKNNEYRDNKNDVFIAVNQYNKLFKESEKIISTKELFNELNVKIKKTPHIAVVLFVDKEASCGFVFELIDLIKSLGISHVYCKTKKISF